MGAQSHAPGWSGCPGASPRLPCYSWTLPSWRHGQIEMLRERWEKDLQFNEQQQDEGDAEARIRWRELKTKICALFKWGVNHRLMRA